MTAMGYLREADEFMATCAGTLASVEQMAGSVLSMVTYPLTLAGTIAGAIANTIDRYVSTFQSLVNTPVQYIRGPQERGRIFAGIGR